MENLTRHVLCNLFSFQDYKNLMQGDYHVEDDEDIYWLPIIEDHFVLNYELGKVSTYSEIENEFKVIKKYKKEQIKN